MRLRIITISTLLFLLSACGVRSSGSPPDQILFPNATWTRPPVPSPVLPTNMPAITGTQMPVSTNATATTAPAEFPYLQAGTATLTSIPTIPALQPATRPAPSATLTQAVIIQPTPTRSLTPVPTTAKLSYQSLLNLLGKSQTDPAFLAFTNSNGCYDDSTPIMGIPMHFWKCISNGIEMQPNSGGRIDSIWLYGRPADGYAVYPGELPNRVTWQDTRATVEQKMGPPDRTSVTSGQLNAIYLGQSCIIVYQSTATSSRMDNIVVKLGLR